MIKALISDFSRVILFPKIPAYTGELNALYKLHRDDKNYDASDYFYLNTELLTFYKSLEDTVDNYIFTTGIVQNQPTFRKELDPIFKTIFTVPDIGFEKDNPAAYREISKRLNISPNEIIFIDDSEKNVTAAHFVGIKTFRYDSNQSVIKKIQQILE